jgi:hypothetical protein
MLMRKTRLAKQNHGIAAESRCRAPPPQAPAAASGSAGASGNCRTAVPVFMGRVSPVLDTCTQLILLGPDGKQEAARRKIHMMCTSIFERASQIYKLGIGVIICGTLSDAFYNLLRGAGIDLVCGITGDIDDVIDAYFSESLDKPRFRMPGFE